MLITGGFMEGRVLALLACEGTMRPVNRRREPVMCTENWRTAHSGAAEVHRQCLQRLQ